MNDFLIIQEFLEEILSEHYIEAQVIYQLLEMEEDIRHSTLTYIYRVILVEKIPGETIQYINVEINKIVQKYFGLETFVEIDWSS